MNKCPFLLVMGLGQVDTRISVLPQPSHGSRGKTTAAGWVQVWNNCRSEPLLGVFFSSFYQKKNSGAVLPPLRLFVL